MNRLFIASAIVALCLAQIAAAQELPETEKVLLPIVLRQPVSGAFGSRWATSVSLLNRSTRRVYILNYERPCNITCVPIPTRTESGVTFRPELRLTTPTIPSQFLQIERDAIDDVSVQIRVQDLSRQAETWGTAVAAVRETNALRGAVSILDVPAGNAFRVTLRVYDFDPAPSRQIKISVYGVRDTSDDAGPPDALLLTMIGTFDASGLGPTLTPGYLQLDNLASRAEVRGYDRLRLDFDPVTPGLRYWAIASVTNNATQHVTVLTPSH